MTSMRRIALFVEDSAHELFLSALVRRLRDEYKVDLEIIPRSVRGGHGKVIKELKQYLIGLENGWETRLDALVVATDANCNSLSQRRKEIEEACEGFEDLLIPAIPDPHIERWLLLDSAAFKIAVGKGCDPPDNKCERDRYKGKLREALLEAGITPLLGGAEYAEDIVKAMDLQRMERIDDSLGERLRSLRNKFQSWS